MKKKQTSLLTINIGPYLFKPDLLATIATLLGLSLLIALGFWQIDRAFQKKIILEQYHTRQQAKPLHLNQVDNVANLQYHPIEIEGHFDNTKSYLLDNRSYQHQIGYNVITPFIPKTGGNAVLVNRGFIARLQNRQPLPIITAITGNVTVLGILYLPSKTFLLSDQTELFNGWPKIIQQISIEDISNELNYKLAPFVVMMDPNNPLSYPQSWTPSVTTPDKHYGYALQWFSFSFILLFIYLYHSISKRDP